MTKSRPSKKECWKTWKDQVEIMMAKKRTRSIAIAVGLCAYSLFYPFREKQKSREAMENCGVSPHGLTTAFLCLSPSHISQPQESSSSVNWEGVVSMAAEGGVGQTTSTPPHTHCRVFGDRTKMALTQHEVTFLSSEVSGFTGFIWVLCLNSLRS